MNKIFPLLFIVLFSTVYSQETPKTLNAKKINETIKIDGNLNEPAWKNAEAATDFVMFYPGNGDLEPTNQKTIVKVLYDNKAIYIGAYMYDDKPNTIHKQFADRDNIDAQADFFEVAINPNNDGQNDTEFFVSAANTQGDAKVSLSGGEDFSWNGVWYSKAKIVKDGWIVEIKIPYSALRFSNGKEQVWGINFQRNIKSTKEQYSWNYIDKTKGNVSQYDGKLLNLGFIKPPIRLSFSPFVSSVLNNFEGSTTLDNHIGLDLKYGLSESFTLDATLIPDFSQTAFDNLVLNLGPFETKFSEKRPFFIEGADLFNKGNLFFSRRIGNNPVISEDDIALTQNEKIIKYPTEIKLLNAIKISGRTKNGLGIAVLNAISKKSEAIIKDTIANSYRKVITNPISNYNVMVLDQVFHQNSSVSLINTNVTRSGNFRDANVTGLLFDISNKANSFNINGGSKTSIINENKTKSTGLAGDLKIGKTKGNFKYSIEGSFKDKNYDINDLGFQRRNNIIDGSINLSYEIFKPTKHFNEFKISTFAYTRRLFKPNVYTGNWYGLNMFATTLKQLSFGLNFGTSLYQTFDYYEPRTEGRFYRKSPEFNLSGFISSDYRKTIALDASLGTYSYYNDTQNGYSFRIAPRYKANDQLQFIYSFNFNKSKNQRGYTTTLADDTIIFGIRNNKTIENTLSGKYNFNSEASLSLAFRYNWSSVQYSSNYYQLNFDGRLSPNSYNEPNDINFNSWNFDLSYSWRFTRGSQLLILYRNSILNEDNQSKLSFSKNLSNLFKQPIQQSLSVKLIYYLDYNKLKAKT